MKTLLIKNGHIIDPASNLDMVGDLLIEEGKIGKIASTLSAPDAELLDARGLVVSPGFIDLHVHLREPGREDEETIETGSQTAVAGGFTAVCCMPNTSPVNDNPAVTQLIVEKAERQAACRIFPIGAISLESKGEKLAEIGEMVASGAVGISDDGRGVMNGQLLRRAMEYSLPFDIPVIEHCEDTHLARQGVMNEGFYSTLLGLKGISRLAEDSMAARDIQMAGLIGAHLHIAHLSTRGTLELVREAKRKGLRVTCEVAPHHFSLTDAACCGYDPNTKMNPPLRTEDDVATLLEGFADGTVDCIATDHAPHNPNEKALEFDRAPFGILGLETALGLALTKLVHAGKISLNRLIELFSTNPARIIHKPLGELRPGALADITIFDPAAEWIYDVRQTRSKSRNSPFDGTLLKGRVAATLVSGRVVYRNPAVIK
jgi:dihydroorotase